MTDISMIPGRIFPRMATLQCLKICCSRIQTSKLDLELTILSKLKQKAIDIYIIFSSHFRIKDELPEHDLLVFTGPIDAYFASQGLPKLEYRSIYWEKEYIEPAGKFFQPAWVVNYPEVRST